MDPDQRVSDDVKLLISIPGIDFYLASMLSSYIGDIKRFQSSDRLASFFGIVPSNMDSSSTIRRDHMSKEGSGSFAHVSTMRKLVRMIFVMLNERKKWKYEITSLTEDKKARLEED